MNGDITLAALCQCQRATKVCELCSTCSCCWHLVCSSCWWLAGLLAHDCNLSRCFRCKSCFNT